MTTKKTNTVNASANITLSEMLDTPVRTCPNCGCNPADEPYAMVATHCPECGLDLDAPAPATEPEATYLEDAVVVYANPQTEPSIPDFRYITAVKGNRRYYLLLHGAVRYGAIVKSKQARNIPYFEETINGKKYWVVDAVPSKEDLEAYEASKTQKTAPTKVKRSEASVAFFAAAFKH